MFCEVALQVAGERSTAKIVGKGRPLLAKHRQLGAALSDQLVLVV